MLPLLLALSACATDEWGLRGGESPQEETGEACESVSGPARVVLEAGGRQAVLDPLLRHGPAQLLKAETGLELSAVARQVKAVVVARPAVTVALTPAAAYMAEQGMEGSEGVHASAPASSGAGPAPRRYRLERVEEWRKPRLTEDGQIHPFKGTRTPPEPIVNLGRNRAGKTVTNGKDTVRFDKDGFAEFETKFETIIDGIHIGSGRHRAHFKAANQRLHEAIKADPRLAQELRLSPEEIAGLPTRTTPPEGYAWHHHQDVGRMQLITDGAHQLAKPHTGGMAIWGGGY